MLSSTTKKVCCSIQTALRGALASFYTSRVALVFSIVIFRPCLR